MAQETINIDPSYKQTLIPKIDEQNYFCLTNHRETFPRRHFFNFLLGLGYHYHIQTPLESKEGLYRVENMRNEKSFYPAIYFAEVVAGNPERIDEILNEEKVYNMIEEYANTGFSVLSDYYSNLTSENLMLTLLAEMDETYEVFAKDFPQTEE